MLIIDWHKYLKNNLAKLYASSENFVIDEAQQYRNKEVMNISIGRQKMRLVYYLKPDAGHFKAYVPPSGIPSIPRASQPIWIDKSNQVVILKWISGRKLFSFDDCDVDSHITDATWSSVGETLARVHEYTYNRFSHVEMEPSFYKSLMCRYFFGAIDNFRDFVLYSFIEPVNNSLQNAVLRSLLSIQDAFTIQQKCEEVVIWVQEHDTLIKELSLFSVLHGDTHPENIIIRDDLSATLIDWEWWHIGDPASEIAFLFEQMDQAGVSAYAVLLKSYFKHRSPCSLGNTASFIKRINLYKRIILGKFTAMVANGLCSPDLQSVNQPLFKHLYNRLKLDDWREIKCL
ncbi:hypothetical protein CL633_01340 [bacterium]|nr:hypothetical protein [bacterium]|tara:strand:- start:10124 stop:11155 length:1032 start_codon:yes stop_codon:yes gene_type:complete